MKPLGVIGGALVAALLLGAPVAAAEPPPERTAPVRSTPQISPQEAAKRAMGKHGGRVLSVEPDGVGFRVKLLKDGVVRTVYVGP